MLRKLLLSVLLTLFALGALSRAQTVVITPNTTSLSPAGGTLTFTTTISYTTPPAVLAFTTTLPAGWTYLSTTSSSAGTLNAPPANTTGALNWFYTPPTPASPATFSFTTSYPAGLTGLHPLSTATITRPTVDSTTATTSPGPTVTLTAPPAAGSWLGGTGNWTDTVQWSAGTVPNNAGNATFSAQISAGTATISAGSAFALNNLLLLGGALNNLGTLTMKDTGSSWTAGVISGAGQLINDSGAHLVASGTANHDFNQQTITNRGQFVWSGAGNLRSGGGGSFVNATGAVFTDTSASGSLAATRITASGFTGNFTFANAGTYVKSGSGETKIEIPFANSGTILVNAGNLHFDTTFTMNGGVLRVVSGAVTQLDLGLNLTGGALTGGGTVLGNVTNGAATGPVADLSPGDPLGQLTIQGNLTLLATSRLLLELGGTAKGVSYDFLNVSGSATLGGTLALSFTNNFRNTISPADTFTVLTAATALTGAFANVPSGSRLMTAGSQGSFLVTYSGTSVVLSAFDPIPEPSTWALLGLGVLLGFGRALFNRKR